MTNWKKENKERRCDIMDDLILISNKANIYIPYAFSVLL